MPAALTGAWGWSHRVQKSTELLRSESSLAGWLLNCVGCLLFFCVVVVVLFLLLFFGGGVGRIERGLFVAY